MNVKLENGHIIVKYDGVKDKAVCNAVEISKALTNYMNMAVDFSCESNIFSFRNVKEEIVVCVEKYIFERLIKSYDDNTDDEFLLTAGFVLNMYYITGLYERLGKFDVQKISAHISEEKVKYYLSLMSEYTFSKIANFTLMKVVEEITGLDVGYTEFKLSAAGVEDKWTKLIELLLETLNNNSEIVNAIDKKHRYYAIYSATISELEKCKSLKDEGEYLSTLLEISPEYRYAHMYKLLESVNDYCVSGEKDRINVEFISYKKILGEELFYAILDSNSRESSDLLICDNDYRTQLGIPKINVEPVCCNSSDVETLMKENVNPCNMFDIFDEIKGRLIRFIIPTDKHMFIHNSILLSTELAEKNEKLESEKKEKIDLINDFSHRYGKRKESFLKDIAEYLLNIDNKDVRYYGRLALYEVSRKYNMDKDVEILKDTYSDNFEFLKKIRVSTKYSQGESNLQYIIDETIKSCIITLLYDRTSKGKKLRYKVFKKENSEEIDDILYDYEESVIVNGSSALEWLKAQQIIDIKFDVNGFWNNLYFCENEYSAVVLSDILSELIFNAIKYAEQKNAIEISFGDDEDFLTITETNSISDAIRSDSGKGIKSCSTLLKRFHKPLNLDFEPIIVNISENIFKEKIRLSKKLFVEE